MVSRPAFWFEVDCCLLVPCCSEDSIRIIRCNVCVLYSNVKN